MNMTAPTTTGKKLIQFGAGNIGRSFIGQLFARGGYEVVFVDIDRAIVDALNSERCYRVIVKKPDGEDDTIMVDHVRAVDGRDIDTVAREIGEADYIATSVGKNAIPHIMPALTHGLKVRFGVSDVSVESSGDRAANHGRPLDIIIAENVRDGAALFRRHLMEHLPKNFRLDELVGLVETSIGKMVPIMTDEDKAVDPLWVFAEPYNTLIVDGRGFRGGAPEIPDLKPVENITAYVDRKLFIHNMGHAAAAYLGHRTHPEAVHLWEVMEDPEVVRLVRGCMTEAACALNAAYPDDLPYRELLNHIEDLLDRFTNKGLGDTLHRVGRDLYRKLGRNDRLIGAILFAHVRDLPYSCMADAVSAAVGFDVPDETGSLYPTDAEFLKVETPKGLRHILEVVCGLERSDPADQAVIANITKMSRTQVP